MKRKIAYEKFYTKDKFLQITYQQIFECVESKSRSWSELNLAKGSKITFVNLTGIDLIVHIIAALNLGYIFSVLTVSKGNAFTEFLALTI